jgi:hypothetical protein
MAKPVEFLSTITGTEEPITGTEVVASGSGQYLLSLALLQPAKKVDLGNYYGWTSTTTHG